ncbi:MULTISPECIES: MmcQ/YjbR family DNA-binding protein [unclassified Arthrobacter]|uniref:MmcQ/YjbR family DNA-binding protein n=1 Tax=unclassified Arthrobacter TaxID=235627 RepID=UPI0003F850B7|nr:MULTISPECIES: MmcQ/YjbR family DNA-binding protein [unclassified Arthrobacter]PVE18815.1 MmcQ/YjbR family DNA-binding protein [Arthrobacter sp. Bz4]
MDPVVLREFCLALPGAFEDFPFGPAASVFKVRAAGGAAKMFALSDLSAPNLSVSLKCEPQLAEQLRAAHPEIVGAYHLNKTHWNGVSCTGNLPDAMIRDMIEDSYDLVVASLPARDRETLGWSRLAADGKT